MKSTVRFGSIFVSFVLALSLSSTSYSAPENAEPKASQQASASAEPGYPAVFSLIEENIDVTSGVLVEKKHRVIKLISPDAVQRFSTLQFPYEASAEKITVDEVNITGPDGKVRPISPSEFKEFSPFEKYAEFSNFKVLGMQIKDIQPGSILEYATTRTTQPWISGEYWNETFLQELDPIPILKETITLVEKEGKQADVKVVHGSLTQPQVSRTGGVVSRTWTFEKLPPYPQEFSMPSPIDVVPRLVVSTLSGWDKILQAIRSRYFAGGEKTNLDETYQDIVKKSTTPEEKLKAVYAFVDETIRSVPPVIGDFGKVYHPLDLNIVVKQGYGDSRDKSALLALLLTKAGFHPELALLSTVGNGMVLQNLPLPFSFNRSVVKVDLNGQTFWLDPYVENCPFGYLSPEDQGRQALLLESGKFTETPIYSPAANLREVSAQAKISANGDLEVTLEVKARGADALGMRSVLKSMTSQERQQVVASLASQVASQPQIEAVTMSSIDDSNNPIMLGLKFQVKNYATTAGDLAFLTLPVNILNYLSPILSQNGPRNYPFILGNTVAEVKRLDLTIPSGFKIRTVPKGIKIDNPLGSYAASFTSLKNKLTFQSKLTLNKIEFSPKEFDTLKGLISDKSKIEESKIVLQKGDPRVSETK